MKLLEHQTISSKKIQKKLKKYNVCLLAGEPRSGKTLSFIDAASKLYKRVLIITTKTAMDDIQDAIDSYDHGIHFDLINYHSCHKFHAEDYDCIVLDEAHTNITGYPKTSTIWKMVFEFTKKCLPIIYSSGTPTPEGYAGLFHMFKLSYVSPWRHYKRFTLWYQDYGKLYQIRINNISINQYDRTIEHKVKKDVKKYIVTITRKEAGHKYEPTDELHDVPLSKKQKKIIEILDRDKVYDTKKYTILGDTPSKLNTKKRQICGGAVKCEDDKLMTFKKLPKVEYIKRHFDPNNTIILAFYIQEQKLLSEIFPNVGSITTNSKGKDYSHFEHMVIYSMGHAAETYEQVRVRQANMKKRKSDIVVHFLLSDIDHKVYEAVSNKENFTSSWYRANK